ncbi:MAG: YggT family protein [Alphaproteobacteria bacterium]|nr:YggT family protein [Alphaproteobacteria bacterium]
MHSLFNLIDRIIQIIIWILIFHAVLSWLVAFGVINRFNRGVANIFDTLSRITDPLLYPIRRLLPYIGGVDLSPLVLILLLYLIQDLLHEYWMSFS